MKFYKVHGLGNDFLLIDNRASLAVDWPAFARRVCKRRASVGADGVLLIENSDQADVRMRIYNADGSEAEMCGNGIRCFAKFAFEHGIVKTPAFTVETLAGIKRPLCLTDNGRVVAVRVDMGEPLTDCSEIPVAGEGKPIGRTLRLDGQEIVFTSVLVGVPHTMVFVDDVLHTDVAGLGNKIEHAPEFPRRTNVNFVQVVDRGHVIVRTWERGCGCTLACGTGASSTLVACVENGVTDRKIDVSLELGHLTIEWAEDNHVYMTGPAEIVFESEIEA